MAALFWNLFVAHYREALPPDYPAPPDTTQVAQLAGTQIPAMQSPAEQSPAAQSPAAQSPAAQPSAAQPLAAQPAQPAQPDSVPESCWRGPDETHADQEALCLFFASPFGLNGFYSYMLLLIGLAMCAAAAMDWFKTDDPYPGYGKRERHRRDTDEKLLADRRELLRNLNELHDEASRKLRTDFRDPVDQWQLVVGTYNKLLARHTDLVRLRARPRKELPGRARQVPERKPGKRGPPTRRRSGRPPWSADWDLPEAPAKTDLPSEARRAQQRSREMHKFAVRNANRG